MFEHVSGLRQLQAVLLESSRHTGVWCVKVEAQVIKPMENAYHLCEQTRSKISKDDKEQNTRMGDKAVEVEKHKVSCLKLWEELTKLRKERAEEMDKSKEKQKADKLAKIADKIKKAKEKTRKEFGLFEEMQTAHLSSMAEYRTKTLPQRLRLLEQMEIDRLDTCERLLSTYADARVCVCVGAHGRTRCLWSTVCTFHSDLSAHSPLSRSLPPSILRVQNRSALC
jgi:hypothetical protein